MDAVLVLMCGLPGAGKTTLARELTQRHINELHGWGSTHPVQIERISFDDLYATASAAPTFNPVHWKATQEEMVTLVKSHVSRHRHGAPGSVLVLLIDDNFHYRSMRKRFFHIADEASCGFGIVFVDTPETICRARNATRDGAARVPDEAFVRMAEAFEAPDASIYHHEKNVVVVRCDPTNATHQQRSVLDMASALGLVMTQAAKQWTTARLTQHANAIQLERQAEDTQRTAASATHAVDLALRRWISSVLHDETTLGLDIKTKQHKAALAKILNERRKQFLSELKAMAQDGGLFQIDLSVTRFQAQTIRVLTELH